MDLISLSVFFFSFSLLYPWLCSEVFSYGSNFTFYCSELVFVLSQAI